MAQDDGAVCVDKKGFRYTVDSPAHAGITVAVDADIRKRVAIGGEEASCVFGLVLIGDAENLDLLGQQGKGGCFGPSWRAPAGKNIYQKRASLEIDGGHGVAGFPKIGKGHGRCRLADHRRGKLGHVTLAAKRCQQRNARKSGKHEESGKGDQKGKTPCPHCCLFAAVHSAIHSAAYSDTYSACSARTPVALAGCVTALRCRRPIAAMPPPMAINAAPPQIQLTKGLR